MLFFPSVKSFDTSIGIIGNFVLNAKNSNDCDTEGRCTVIRRVTCSNYIVSVMHNQFMTGSCFILVLFSIVWNNIYFCLSISCWINYYISIITSKWKNNRFRYSIETMKHGKLSQNKIWTPYSFMCLLPTKSLQVLYLSQELVVGFSGISSQSDIYMIDRGRNRWAWNGLHT